MPTNSTTNLKTIVDFARRKGFVFQSSEIYGGFAATYDFGPLGKLLKDNLVNSWRDFMVNYRIDTVEIEGAIFLHPKVWEASGHISGFSDLLVEDLVTKKRFRADHLVEEAGVIWPLGINSAQKSENTENKLENNENFYLPFIIHFAKNNQNKIWPKSIIAHFQKLNSQSENNQEQNLEQKINTLIQSLLFQNLITATEKNDEYVAISTFLETFENQILTDAGSLSALEIDEIIEYYNLKSVDGNPLSKARKFNLLVKTHLGPIEDDSSLAYLKGEACQNIYVNWKQTQETTRRKLPFGVGQMGKAFRNEITVKQYMFRTREFEQIDMQYFVKPPEFVNKEKGEMDHYEWFAYWKDQRFRFYTEFLGYNSQNLKWHQHSPEELVFYAAEAWDIYYNFGQMGYKEMEGVHNRTDYDTKQHQKFSGTDLTYLDPETNQRYLPYIVEMSLGVNRLFLSTLFEFYTEEEIVNPENAELDEQIKSLEGILESLKS